MWSRSRRSPYQRPPNWPRSCGHHRGVRRRDEHQTCPRDRSRGTGTYDYEGPNVCVATRSAHAGYRSPPAHHQKPPHTGRRQARGRPCPRHPQPLRRRRIPQPAHFHDNHSCADRHCHTSHPSRRSNSANTTNIRAIPAASTQHAPPSPLPTDPSPPARSPTPATHPANRRVTPVGRRPSGLWHGGRNAGQPR